MTTTLFYRSFLLNRLKGVISRMFSIKNNYEEAVQKLNLLQSNKSNLEQIRRDLKAGKEKCTNLEDMKNYLIRAGISLTQLDKLSVIHVAGTKGKGSTSALCESILRHHGHRTGFYSSPHLVAVRERIRLNGCIIGEEKFAKHFHEVYHMLDVSKTYDGDMPKYFAFLTVLAYYMFLKEKVDVAIIEVGIGGIVDYTNVLRKVSVVGITALGLDHTSILGNTIEQIAEAKAGIMKPACVAYTVPQPPEALRVLRRVAAETPCTLEIAPEYSIYRFPVECNLPINIEAYKTNASLAIQLAHAWIRLSQQRLYQRQCLRSVVSGKNNHILDRYILPDQCTDGAVNKIVPIETVKGLQECKWPGRYQIVESDYATFYLDGAHTKESMEICAQWFQSNNRNENRFLIFGATGDRNSERLLRPLKSILFNSTYFVVPHAYKELNKKNDNYSAITEHNESLERCYNHVRIWKEINTNLNSEIEVLDCVSDALIEIKRKKIDSEKNTVLITGSLHLVGAALSILNPNLSSY